MKIQMLEEAEQELVDGHRFYERQADGLGDYFLNSLSADIDSLLIYAGVHAVYFGFHRALSKRFPYAIYYLVQDEVISVYAVLDCRREPVSHLHRLN